jgi:hypothetical protein
VVVVVLLKKMPPLKVLSRSLEVAPSSEDEMKPTVPDQAQMDPETARPRGILLFCSFGLAAASSVDPGRSGPLATFPKQVEIRLLCLLVRRGLSHLSWGSKQWAVYW